MDPGIRILPLTNEEILERIGEKRTLCRNSNCIGHNLRRNCLFHDVIEGQITEVKGIEAKGGI